MKTYNLKKVRNAHLPRRIVMLVMVFVVMIVAAVVGVRRWYVVNLEPVSVSKAGQHFTVASGATLGDVATALANDKLIRSDQAFSWYVSSQNARDKLQAGTYTFSPSESTEEIANAIINGKVATDLVTILPGQRLDQVRAAFIKAGFKVAAVDAALKPEQYRHAYPALADNPPYASLEGFLYPDTFQKTADTDPKRIIEESLTEMQDHLTTDIRAGFSAHKLTVFQGVTLASMVEQEVPSQSDRDQAAQVFLKRLSIGMPLGSDVTAYYGAIHDGIAPSVAYDSPYNTRIHKGIPIGPISNVSQSSLEAVAHPAKTSWLYFVAGDDGKTYFAKTLQQHLDNVARYCKQACSEAP